LGGAGSMISRSPSLRMTASSPGNSNSRGIRTARFRPFLKTFTCLSAATGQLTQVSMTVTPRIGGRQQEIQAVRESRGQVMVSPVTSRQHMAIPEVDKRICEKFRRKAKPPTSPLSGLRLLVPIRDFYLRIGTRLCGSFRGHDPIDAQPDHRPSCIAEEHDCDLAREVFFVMDALIGCRRLFCRKIFVGWRSKGVPARIGRLAACPASKMTASLPDYMDRYAQFELLP
jgi:hypothetical protein